MIGVAKGIKLELAPEICWLCGQEWEEVHCCATGFIRRIEELEKKEGQQNEQA